MKKTTDLLERMGGGSLKAILKEAEILMDNLEFAADHYKRDGGDMGDVMAEIRESATKIARLAK